MRRPGTRARVQRGFTLVEVLVAVAILALVMGAFIASGSQYADQARYLQQKTLALWVAHNRLVEYELAPDWPDTGRDEGRAEMAGREWVWQTEVNETQDPAVRRVDVAVYPLDPETDKPAETPLASLSGFLTRPGGGALTVPVDALGPLVNPQL